MASGVLPQDAEASCCRRAAGVWLDRV